MTVNITPTVIRPSHLSAIAQLERLCFAEPWSEQSLGMLCRAGGTGVVIADEGQDSPALSYGGMTYLAGVEGSVTNIATHPDHRRCGLARAVLSALIEQARALALGEIFLEVRASNAAAIALYRAFGFEEIGTRKGFYRLPTEDALMMRLSLDIEQK